MVDSNFASNRIKRRSTSGSINTIGGTIVGWGSKMQRSAVLSSSEAEYCAMAMSTQDLLFCQNLLDELCGCEKPGILFEDNEGAIYLAKNCQVGQRTKHIDNRYHFMRDVIKDGKMQVIHVRSDQNEADLCTKNVTIAIHEKFRENIRNGRLRIWEEYGKLIPASMSRREDVKKRAVNEGVHDIDTGDVDYNLPFEKRMKISW